METKSDARPLEDDTGRSTRDFPLPLPGGEGFGVIGISFLLATFLLAVSNLTIFEPAGRLPKISSALWISMLMFMLVMDIHIAGGIAFWAKCQVARFAKVHWVRIVRNDPWPSTISIGFELFGRDFDRFRIALPDITKIDWTSGQATELAGRDMNDWHVALWYRKKRRSGNAIRSADEPCDLVLIGPQGTKEETAELGERLVRFLVESGVDLIQVSEAEYRRNSSEVLVKFQHRLHDESVGT
ncbi:hypothetical protein GC170_01290 [bacterium]|nr:hypothetical protein [bacterium]